MSRFIRTISQSVGALAVLSLVCTSVAVADPTSTVAVNTATTAATASVAPTSSTTTATDADIAQGGPLSDVPEGHWAYDAVAQLVKDGLIKGYPDGLFKGNRPMTRYEAAVLTYRAVDQIEAQITANKAVAQADIDAVKKLMAAFAAEMKQVEAHLSKLDKSVDTLNGQYKNLKTEADATQLRVNQGKVGFQMLYNPGTAYTYVQGYRTATGLPLAQAPGNPAPTVGFGEGALQNASVGPVSHGIGYNLSRFFIGGQIDPRWSYGLRVSAKIVYEPPQGGITSVSPALCTAGAVNCSFSDLNNGQSTIPVNLDYAYAGYNTPGGITLQLGRYGVGSYGKFAHVEEGLVYAGQSISGFNVGYNDPQGHFYAQMYYGIPSVSSYTLTTYTPCTPIIGVGTGLVNYTGGNYPVNPNCNTTQSEVGGWLVYYFSGPRVAIGGTYDVNVGKQYTFFDPYAVACTVGTGATAVTSMAVNGFACQAQNIVGHPATYNVATPVGNYLTAQSQQSLLEAYLSAYFGSRSLPQFNWQVAWVHHLGFDPFTGVGYAGANALSTSLTYASKGNLYSTGSNNNPFLSGAGRRNSNVAQLVYESYGVGSVGGIQGGNFTGTTPFQNNSGFSNQNGIQMYGTQLGHWFSDSVRMGLSYYHLQNINGALQPIGTNGGAPSAATNGFVSTIQENNLAANFYLYFF